MNLTAQLPLIWAAILGVAVMLYVILDGFELGMGMLFPFARDDGERDRMLASIAPYWDGNQTWLVLGGGGLLVAFPRAYAIVMPAFYLPLIVMLLALMFRGVTFYFRAISHHKHLWNVVFAAASTLVGLCQGVVLGGLVQGIRVENGAFAGGPFDWATPFGLMCALGVAAGYALLGATWLILKTDGDIAQRAAAKAKALLVMVLVFMAAVSIFTPLTLPRIRAAFVKCEASRDGMIRGKSHTMLNDGDIDQQRHIRGAVGAIVAAVLNDTALFVSGGAEHQGPNGGGFIAVIAEKG